MWRGGSPFSLLRGYTTARVEVLPSVLCVKMSAISASEKVDGFTRKSVRKAQRQRRSQGSSQYRTQSVPVELSPLPQLKGTVRGWRSLPLKIGWHLWWPVSVLDQQQVHLLPERNQCKYRTQFRSAKNSIRFPIQRRHDSTCDFFKIWLTSLGEKKTQNTNIYFVNTVRLIQSWKNLTWSLHNNCTRTSETPLTPLNYLSDLLYISRCKEKYHLVLLIMEEIDRFGYQLHQVSMCVHLVLSSPKTSLAFLALLLGDYLNPQMK